MDTHMIIEMIGYIGSILVVVSMLMSSVMKLRVINSVGCCIFAAYALIIHSYPTALMNVCLVIINIYNVYKLMKHNDRHYHLVEGTVDDTYLDYFLKFYAEDIKEFFPEFHFEKDMTNTFFMVCCEEHPAGVLLGHKSEDGALDIALEYSTPVYRDCSVGKYLYGKLPEKGIHELIYSGDSPKHEPYLEKMGYDKNGDKYTRYIK